MPNAKTDDALKNRKIVSREEWLKERIDLLIAEKDLTRKSDELARRRQALPVVRVDKEYKLATDDGDASLAALFKSNSQLLIYHFMFGPDFEAGCPACSASADAFNGMWIHLANHDVSFWAVSQAPLAKLLAYKKRMGWNFPWASAAGSDFNFDFNVSYSEEQVRAGIEYNYAREEKIERPVEESSGLRMEAQLAEMCGTDAPTFLRDRPGMSTFMLEDGVVYHAYSAYSRGLDALSIIDQWLDRAPLGRNESGLWLRRHDEYDTLAYKKADSCCPSD